MARSAAATTAGYLKELPPDRRATIAAVREVVATNMPKGYVEDMAWGMIAWSIPLSRYPDTYNKQPLCYVALASQKNYCALYLTGVYTDPKRLSRLEAAFDDAGKKLDRGKSCVRFRTPDDLPLPAIGKLIADVTPARYIAEYEAARATQNKTRNTKTKGEKPSRGGKR